MAILSDEVFQGIKELERQLAVALDDVVKYSAELERAEETLAACEARVIKFSAAVEAARTRASLPLDKELVFDESKNEIIIKPEE